MSIFIFILIFSIMIMVHELGHFLVAKRLKMRVDKFAIGFGKKIFSFKKHDTEYCFNILPFGGYVKIAGFSEPEYTGKRDEFLSRPIRERIGVIFAGPFVNYLFAFLCFWMIFVIGYPRFTSTIGTLVKDMPALKSGLMAKDKIISIDKQKVEYWDEVQDLIYTTDKDVLSIEVKRNDELLTFQVPVVKHEIDDIFGKKHTLRVIGITASSEFTQVKYNVFASCVEASKHIVNLTALTYNSLWWMATGKLSFRESVTGPIGIYDMTKQVVKLGFIAVLNLMAVLSTSLALFNLLPFPVLDGGHIFFLFLEKIRSRKLSQRVEDFVTNIGLSFIILVAVYVFYNDLMRFGHIDKLTNFIKNLIQ